jgi:pimeloyl-ACP methyl ester carboxylesterase
VAVLRVPGGELYYEAEGDGVAVVLVHGLALDARMWDDQVPALKDIARVVRYDVRGFGRSSRDADTSYSHAEDLWRLLDHLEIDTAVLVGLSMGGRIVVEATLAAPERVRALVLLDAVLDGVPWDPDSEVPVTCSRSACALPLALQGRRRRARNARARSRAGQAAKITVDQHGYGRCWITPQ